MSKIENTASLRDKYKRKPDGMKGMAEGYDTHMLDVTRICTKIFEALTSHHIDGCWKSCSMLSASDVANLTQLYGKNIRHRSQDEEVADLLS